MKVQEVEKDILETLIGYLNTKEDPFSSELEKYGHKYDKTVHKVISRMTKRIASLDKVLGHSNNAN
jgi:hypothetical protein